MNIYIPIEVKVRELEGRSLLAFTAAERGHLVILGEKKDTLNLARDGILPPGIVHDKSLTPGDYKIKNFTELKKHGHLITAQDEESGLLDQSFDTFSRQRFSDETVELSDKIFCWGDHDLSSLKNNYPDFKDRFIKTGSPRVDIWRTDFDELYKNKVPHNRRYILIASNFGYPLDKNPLWNKVARLRQAGYFDRDENMERYMFENNAYQHRLLFEFVVMIRKLAKQLKDIDIIVRPHPIESVDAWEKILGDYSNIYVKKDGSISKWIRHSIGIIHNGCTSAVEAAVSKVPRIAYRPIPDKLEREIPNRLSHQVFDYEELEDTIIKLVKPGNERKPLKDVENDEILLKRFSNAEGSFAFNQIVDNWETIGLKQNLEQTDIRTLEKLKQPEKKPPLRNQFKVKAYKIFQILKGRNERIQKSGKLLKTGHKFPDLKDTEMYDFLHSFQTNLGMFKDVELSRYGKKSFLIFKK